MKTTFKRIIAVILCTVIAIASTGTNTAYAAKKTPPLKVTFNGKSVNIVKVLDDGSEEAATAKAVVKKWGEPDKKNRFDDPGTEYTEYIWKKGKTSIQFTNSKALSNGNESIGHFDVHLEGKKDALCGIKVGMKKTAALKKLKKMFGKDNVCVAKEGQIINFKNGIPVPEGKATGNGETIFVYAYSYVMSLGFSLKDGQISSMGFSS